MATSLSNLPSLADADRFLLEAAKRVRTLKKAKTAAKPKKGKAGAKRKPDQRAWLTRSVTKRKAGRVPPARVAGKTLVAPTSARPAIPVQGKINIPTSRPIAGVQRTITPTGGFVPGTQIAFIPVISSNVAAIAHDEEQSLLYVQFLDGSVYRYDDVDRDTFLQFESAPSKGKWVWAVLRNGGYNYERIA